MFDKFDMQAIDAVDAYASVDKSVVNVFQCPSTDQFPRATKVTAAPDSSPLVTPMHLGAKDYSAAAVVKLEPLFKYASGAWVRRPGDYVTPSPLALIRDGTSNSFLLLERAGIPTYYIGRPSSHPNPWRSDVPTDQLQPGPNFRNFESIWPSTDNFVFEHVTQALSHRTYSGLLINRRNDLGIYAFHTAGAYASFCDGHVSLLAEETDADVILAQFTRDRGETRW